MQIVVIKAPLSLQEWKELAKNNFGDMLKGVVDIQQKIVAVGGELHADAEEILLREGSKQIDLWGFNFYPARSKDDSIEYVSFINIRPSQGNNSMEVKDQSLREKIKVTVLSLVKG